jgi:predicted nucleic acid-binding protein
LIKLLVEEPGSDIANQAYDSSAAASTSAVAYLEASSALARMQKGARLSSQAYRAALHDRDELWAELEVHAVTDSLIGAASRAAAEHALRAYDCLHLATIATFADAERVTVACWDRDLRMAVSEYGFTLLPDRI